MGPPNVPLTKGMTFDHKKKEISGVKGGLVEFIGNLKKYPEERMGQDPISARRKAGFSSYEREGWSILKKKSSQKVSIGTSKARKGGRRSISQTSLARGGIEPAEEHWVLF